MCKIGDPREVAHLKALEGADARLELFEANLIEDGSFDSVVDGCDGVFHTASPVFFESTDPQVHILIILLPLHLTIFITPNH